jgi:hypothetical protein
MPILKEETFRKLINQTTIDALFLLQKKPSADSALAYKDSLSHILKLHMEILQELEAKLRPTGDPGDSSELSDEAKVAVAADINERRYNEFMNQHTKIMALVVNIRSLEQCEGVDYVNAERARRDPRDPTIDQFNLVKATYNKLQMLPWARIGAICNLIELEAIRAMDALEPAEREIRLKSWHLILISLIAIGAAAATAGALAPVAIAAVGVTTGVMVASAAAGAAGGLVSSSGVSMALRLEGKKESMGTIATRIAIGTSMGVVGGVIGGGIGATVAAPLAAGIPSAIGAQVLTGTIAGTGAGAMRGMARIGYRMYCSKHKVESKEAALEILASAAAGAVTGAAAGAIAYYMPHPALSTDAPGSSDPSATPSATSDSGAAAGAKLLVPPKGLLAAPTATVAPFSVAAPPAVPAVTAHIDGGAAAAVILSKSDAISPEDTALAEEISIRRKMIAEIIAKGDPDSRQTEGYEELLAALPDDPTERPVSPGDIAAMLEGIDDDHSTALLPTTARAFSSSRPAHHGAGVLVPSA